MLHLDPAAPLDAVLHAAPLWAPLATLVTLALGALAGRRTR